ncbi:radical SAM protein [Nonomuraea sp. NPDC004297]
MLTDQMWMVADQCNLTCTYCYFETGEYNYTPSRLTAPDYDRWLRRCTPHLPVRSVALTGGEPLLRPDLVELAEVARRHVESVHVFTNAVRMTDEIAEALSRLGCGADVSIDHADPDAPDRVRGGTKATLAGIERLDAAGVPLQIVMVVTSLNWREIEELVRRARERRWQVELLAVSVPSRHPLSMSNLTATERTELLRVIDASADVFKSRVYFERLRHFLISGRISMIRSCVTGQEGAFVNSDGEIWVCAHRGETSLGNIRDVSLPDLLAGKRAALTRRPAGPCAGTGCLSLA